MEDERVRVRNTKRNQGEEAKWEIKECLKQKTAKGQSEKGTRKKANKQ